MNILYLAHRIPFPPDKGCKLRAFRQLEFLAYRHRVWCACFIDDPSDLVHVLPLRNHCHELGMVALHRRRAIVRGLCGLACGSTFTEAFYHSPRMTRLIHQWAQIVRFDAVVAFSSSMAPYALRTPAARRVLDLCDLDSGKWRDYAAASGPSLKWLYRTEAQRLAQRELDWIFQFDAATLITRREADLLPPVARASVHLISNGVNLPKSQDEPPGTCAAIHSSPRTNGLLRRQQPTQSISADRPSPTFILGFLGQMNYQPNVDAVCWFARECWPAIYSRFPGAIFRIVGRRPVRAVRRLARMPGMEVTGEVPDAAAAVARFDISVAPLRIARGLPNKVLEAMAAGKPVVVTSAVAASLEIAHEREALVADDPAAFIAAIMRLLDHPALRMRLGTAARDFVRHHHRWGHELTRFEMLVTGRESEPRQSWSGTVDQNRDNDAAELFSAASVSDRCG